MNVGTNSGSLVFDQLLGDVYQEYSTTLLCTYIQCLSFRNLGLFHLFMDIRFPGRSSFSDSV